MTGATYGLLLPPTMSVAKTIRLVGRFAVFSVSAVGASCPAGASWLSAFLRDHAAALKGVERPRAFMMAHTVGEESLGNDCYRLVDDPFLTVAILGRMAGGIYVPRRAIAANATFDGSFYAFPIRHFPQFETWEVQS